MSTYSLYQLNLAINGLANMSKAINFRIPRNKTAALQHIQNLVVRGYSSWTDGTILHTKLERFVHKMDENYGVTENIQMRARNRAKKSASTHLVIYPCDDTSYYWWLLVTAGRGNVHEMERLQDALSPVNRVKFGEQFELLYRQRTRVQGGGAGWTWRMQKTYYENWEYDLVRAVRSYNTKEVQNVINMLTRMPMFAGVREQVYKLLRRGERVWRRSGERTEVKWPGKLPYLQRIKIWS